LKKLIIFLIVISMLIVPVSAADPEEDALLDASDIDVSIFEDTSVPASAGEISIPAPSAILIEKETGTVIYEKNADERMSPASVTKIMTILLIVEAVENGTISLDDTVSVSANAAGMGGSQIFLKEHEMMSVKDLLKSIVVSSANDAAVAMAEYLCGTEEAFVSKMNERALELGMANTNFCNCTGLSDPDEHLTTARDISIMSRELLKHDWIKEYTTIWMDTIRNGEFGLTNTNKLVRFYEGATGLKTGFTNKAMYCLSASAQRDGIEYIAAVMHCETSADRFESTKTLLSYAFANYTLIPAVPDTALLPVPVKLGEKAFTQPELEYVTSVLVSKSAVSSITKTVEIVPELAAPVNAGDIVGHLSLTDGSSEIIKVPIIVSDTINRLTWAQVFAGLLRQIFLCN